MTQRTSEILTVAKVTYPRNIVLILAWKYGAIAGRIAPLVRQMTECKAYIKIIAIKVPTTGAIFKTNFVSGVRPRKGQRKSCFVKLGWNLKKPRTGSRNLESKNYFRKLGDKSNCAIW